MRKTLLPLAVLAIAAALAGCGTVRGMGEDLSTLGGILTKSSDHYKEAVGKNPPGSKMGTKSE